MSQSEVKAEAMKDNIDQLSKALTDKAHEINALPLDCSYECHVSIGPNGQPVVTCGIVCH